MLVWTDDRIIDRVLIQHHRIGYLSQLQMKPKMRHREKRESNQDIAGRNPRRKQDGINEEFPEKQPERTRERRGKRRKSHLP